jgi:hypothetical protein
MKRKHLAITLITALVLLVTGIASCMIEVEMEGDYTAPDNLKMTLVMEMNGQASPPVEMVKLGQTIYVKDPESDQWLPKHDVASYQDYEGIEEFALVSADIVANFKGAIILGEEAIDGVPCYHVKGAVDTDQIESSPSGFDISGMGMLTAEMWVGKDDYLVRQIIFDAEMEDMPAEAGIPVDAVACSFTFRFADFNEPVTIEPPLQ